MGHPGDAWRIRTPEQEGGRDVPITILSGYRCERLNAAVNGSATSGSRQGVRR